MDAADAGRLVRRALADPALVSPLSTAGAVDVIAVGKVAGPMIEAFAASCPVPPRRLLAIGGRRPLSLPDGTSWHEGAHPVPDERSVDAAQAALALARSTRDHDLLTVLLSGGASSMMALPAGDLTLTDKRETTQTLLSAGVDIHGLNTVRKHLSGIKGGRLAVAARARVMTLAVSDVVDDDISVIGSGPTVPDPTTSLKALSLLNRLGGWNVYPRRVVEWLRQTAEGNADETPKPNDPRFLHSIARVIGGSADALGGGRTAAESLGYHTHVLDEPVSGEARLAAKRYLRIALDAAASLPRPSCILSAGETTVHVTGGGKGGRNQEFALALTESLSGMAAPTVAASIGTDGIDGPTDAAGGIVDVSTLARARAQRLDSPQLYLENNNAYAFFDALGDLIRTGPTTTNVADVQIMLIA